MFVQTEHLHLLFWLIKYLENFFVWFFLPRLTKRFQRFGLLIFRDFYLLNIFINNPESWKFRTLVEFIMLRNKS